MKERIRELMEKSMESTGIEGLGGSYQELNPVKFAQLIAKDCADICLEFGVEDYVDPAFKNRMAWAIKEHFGVEE